jgi:hypothetical protein
MNGTSAAILIALVTLPACEPKNISSTTGSTVAQSSQSSNARPESDRVAPNDAADASPDLDNPDAASATQDLPLFSAASPPQRLAELEASLRLRFDDDWISGNDMGFFSAPPVSQNNPSPLTEDVVRVFATYAWDHHHQRPIGSMAALRQKALDSFSIDFQRGRAAREAILRQRFGPPATVRQTLTSPPRHVVEHQVYGPYYISRVRPISTESNPDAFRLEWYGERPDWAAPPISRESRERFLRRIATSLAEAKTYPDVVALVSSPPSDAGIIIKGALNEEDYWLELKPPMSAIQFSTLFGWKNAIGASVGVHRETWRIVLLTGSNAHGPVIAKPTLGAWQIDASLDGWPAGTAIGRSGPTGLYRLGSKDVVRRIRIHAKDRP